MRTQAGVFHRVRIYIDTSTLAWHFSRCGCACFSFTEQSIMFCSFSVAPMAEPSDFEPVGFTVAEVVVSCGGAMFAALGAGFWLTSA